MVKDRDYLAKIDKLERTHSKTLQDERIAREEMESEMKNKIRTCESEVIICKVSYFLTQLYLITTTCFVMQPEHSTAVDNESCPIIMRM